MSEQATFWDHLDELRWAIIRSLGVVVVFAVAMFCLKDQLFAVVLAPRSSDFVTYRLMGAEAFSIPLMNIGLTEQFMTHMRVAVYAGLLFALPYVLYELFRFISPGLYRHERRAATWIVCSSYLMFALGTAVNYFIIFPFTVRFLGTYQVSADVANMLTLQSYIDTLITMSFVIGLIFELPVVCTILGRMGFVNGSLMRRYRRHAVVAILVVAAIITPTTDVFTLMIVSLPIWLLYEVSILLVGK
ncbi:MAG: twin-arginine translocase subunit TatC [Prevotella sp.]|nr:twin-arginine translocase subunit TatC [Prevotella sp.]